MSDRTEQMAREIRRADAIDAVMASTPPEEQQAVWDEYLDFDDDPVDDVIDGFCDCYCGCSIETFGVAGPCSECRKEIPGDHGAPLGG